MIFLQVAAVQVFFCERSKAWKIGKIHTNHCEFHARGHLRLIELTISWHIVIGRARGSRGVGTGSFPKKNTGLM